MLHVSRLKPREQHRDAAHLRLIRQLPCLACCKAAPSEAAHVRFSSHQYNKVNPGIGKRPADRWTVPLCANCHRIGRQSQHAANEMVWWEQHKIDVLATCVDLYAVSAELRSNPQKAVEAMGAVIRRARRRNG